MKVYGILISSPGDLAEERAVVMKVITVLSRYSEISYGVQLRPITWEYDSFPAFGSEPQAVLNDQLPPNYDIYLGMLWNRIGTATTKYKSGTVEEFEMACDRFHNDPLSVRILLYFKSISKQQASSAEASSVIAFKETVRSRGYYTWRDFLDAAELESFIGIHIYHQVHDLVFARKAASWTEQDDGTVVIMKSNVDLVSGAFDGIFVKLDVTIEKGKEFLDVYGERLSVFEQGTVASSEDVGVNLETLNARIGKVDAHLHVLEPEVNARLKPLTEAYVEFIMAWLKVFMLIDNEDTKLTYDARTSCEEVIDKCLARIDQLDRIVQEMGEQASRFNTLITLISQLPHQPGAVVDYPAAQRIAQSEVQLNARLSFHFSTWRRATLMLQEILVAFPVEQTQQQRSPA